MIIGKGHRRKYVYHLPIRNKYLLDFFPDDVSGYSILDCGFGEGASAFLIKSVLDGVSYIDGIDIFKPNVDRQEKLGLYDNVFLGDIRNVLDYFGYYDVIIATAVIEHLWKYEGLEVLNKLKDMSKLLIVFVPCGEKIDLGKSDNYKGNPYNKHLSSWIESDFENIGFSTYVYDGRRMTRLTRFFDTMRRLFTLNKPYLKSMFAWSGEIV